MDLRRTPANKSGTEVPPMITSSLVSAVFEWMLMFMLFVDAGFSYLVTKFARYCKLQVPCLLCSRLDHVLGNERAGFYWELICRKHKSKISSLVFCQLHDNLVDIHGTCESCLLSFATKKTSNTETCRLLVGKLGDKSSYDPSQAVSSDKPSITGTRNCTCFNKQWIPKMCTQELFYSTSVNNERAEVNEPSSFTSKCNVNEVQEAVEGTSQRDQACNKDTDPLPHTKIKVTSDAESECPFPDNGSASAYLCEETVGQDSEPKSVALSVSPAPEKLIHLAPPIKSLASELEMPSNFACIAESEEPNGHGLEDFNCQPADCTNNVTEISELVSFPEALASPSIEGTHHEEPKDINVSSMIEMEKEVHVESEEVSNLGSGSAGTTELHREVTTECGKTSVAGSDCILDNEIQTNLKSNKNDDTSTQVADNLDLGDAYKLAVGTRGRQLSGRLLEQQRSMTDSTKASEDLMLLLSQISAARGIDLPLNDMSPRVSATGEDFKAADVSSVIGMQILQRRISLERNESNLSFDGSVVNEIDGETVADRLKRQVEHDKKIMSTLYREVEEERNASAIAANQAMAMITRLQEEKAALNMEALQCLRMMEEQAEYDGEALQKANELLVEKDKQIQTFEYELRLYRNQFGDISLSNNIIKPRPESDEGGLMAWDVKANSEKNNETACNISNKDENDTIGNIDGAPKMMYGYANTGRMSLPQFEDERQFILQNLKKLEGKLIMFSGREIYPDLADGAFSTGEILEKNSSKQLYCTGDSHSNSGMDKTHLPRDAVVQREASSEDLSGHKKYQHENEEQDKFISRVHVNRDAEFDEFRYELSALKNRLDVLEVEQNVID